jgi:hypothetical protein
MTDQQSDRRVVQCNYVQGTHVASQGARAYVVRTSGGTDRILILARSRSGRWVKKWEPVSRLTDFRAKILPPEHPLYGRDLMSPEDAWIRLLDDGVAEEDAES